MCNFIKARTHFISKVSFAYMKADNKKKILMLRYILINISIIITVKNNFSITIVPIMLIHVSANFTFLDDFIFLSHLLSSTDMKLNKYVYTTYKNKY